MCWPSVDTCPDNEYMKNFQQTVYFKILMHNFNLFGSHNLNSKPSRNFKKFLGFYLITFIYLNFQTGLNNRQLKLVLSDDMIILFSQQIECQHIFLVSDISEPL